MYCEICDHEYKYINTHYKSKKHHNNTLLDTSFECTICYNYGRTSIYKKCDQCTYNVCNNCFDKMATYCYSKDKIETYNHYKDKQKFDNMLCLEFKCPFCNYDNIKITPKNWIN